MNRLQDIMQHVLSGEISENNTEMNSKYDIAVTGIACSIGKANDKNAFWEMLKKSEDMVIDFPDSRVKDIVQYLDCIKQDYDDGFYRGGFLPEISNFDYAFFSMSPKEASLISPEQRLFLQTAWNAIEDAGYDPYQMRGSATGVYLGFSTDFGREYKALVDKLQPKYSGMSISGNLHSIIASRISYLLDLHGPSLAIDTACSSSLAAVHFACQSLHNGDCDTAIAGSVKIDLLPLISHKDTITEIGITDPHDRTRAFDDEAHGTGLGEGVIALVLKPLHSAIRDEDSVYAVIKGSAMNQDGNSIGITAPNIAAQKQLLQKAWKNAGINAESIAFIEAHGTGTKLGDPIELQAIRQAFSEYTNKRQFCAVGSVKSNVGHLDHAAGMVGLVKAILAISNQQLPPTLHFHFPNPKIEFCESPIYVNDRLRDLKKEEPIRAGVSAFGLSGTNCHVLLEQAPQAQFLEKSHSDAYCIKLTANSIASYNAIRQILLEYMRRYGQTVDLGDLCFTFNTGRHDYRYRSVFLFKTLAQFLIFLENPNIMSENQKKSLNSSPIADLQSSLWNDLISSYLLGKTIDWNSLYQDEKHKRLHLPGYQFERCHCWVNNASPSHTVKTDDMYHQLVWTELAATQTCPDKPDGITVVLAYKDQHDKILLDCLQNNEKNVIYIIKDVAFEILSENIYTIGDDPQCYYEVFDRIKQHKISRIIHMLTSQTASRQETARIGNLQEGLYSVFHIFKAAFDCRIRMQFQFIVLTSYVDLVGKAQQTIFPQNATLIGIMNTIAAEYPSIACKLIDFDAQTQPMDIIKELGIYDETLVAFRNGVRHVCRVNRFDINRYPDLHTEIRENGVYVITGGYGELGLEFASYLSSKRRVKLVLINRSPFPPEQSWNTILRGGNQKLCRKIGKLKAIQENGSEILGYQADVCDQELIRQIFYELRSKYGVINGIIHAAGVPGSGYMALKPFSQFLSVIAPKINGVLALDQSSAEDNLDFFVLFSSISSIIKESGQSDYASANCYLNAYTHYRNNQNKRTLSVCWPAWESFGMAVDNNVNLERELFMPIRADEAVAVFDTLLEKDISTVIVSRIDEQKLISDRRQQCIFDNIISLESDGNVVSSETNLASAESDIPVVKILELIFKEVMGLTKIDRKKSIKDHGGDSILATQILKEINQRLNLALDITDLYTYPNINMLAKFIEAEQRIH